MARAQQPLPRRSALAMTLAVAPQEGVGAAPGWPRQPRKAKSDQVARGEGRQALLAEKRTKPL